MPNLLEGPRTICSTAMLLDRLREKRKRIVDEIEYLQQELAYHEWMMDWIATDSRERQ